MVFGEEYQGMSEREILIEMASEQRTMKATVEQLQNDVRNIRCPSPMCAQHTNDLIKLGENKADQSEVEDIKTQLAAMSATQANTEKAKLSLQAWAGIISVAVLATLDLLIQIYSMTRGG